MGFLVILGTIMALIHLKCNLKQFSKHFGSFWVFHPWKRHFFHIKTCTSTAHDSLLLGHHLLYSWHVFIALCSTLKIKSTMVSFLGLYWNFWSICLRILTVVRCTSLFSFHQTLSIGVSALKINNKEFTILYVGDVIVRYFLSPFLQESWRHFLLIFVIKIRVCFVITVMYFDIFETSVGIPDISTGFSRNKYGE